MTVYLEPNAQTTYALWIRNPQGELLAITDRFNYLEYAKVANDMGALTVELEDIYPESFFVRDSIIEVWRRLPGGRPYMDLNTQWSVSKRQFKSSRGGTDIKLTCHDGNRLLRNKRIAYRSGTGQTRISGIATTIMRQVVLDNLGTDASDSTRFRDGQISSTVFQVEADKALGQSASPHNLIGRRVLNVVQDIADQSTQLGDRIFFDVVHLNNGLLEYRTYKDFIGIDHSFGSGQEVVLSEKRGNLTDVIYTEDDTDAFNVALVGGAGSLSLRKIGVAADTESANASPFATRERFFNAKSEDDQTVLDNIAQQYLEAGKTRITVSGRLVDIGVRYGVNFGWGDRVTVGVRNQTYTARLDGIKVVIKNNEEDIRAMLKVEL